jgi:ATP-dependent Clp protease ATP-binding subunit ClpC
MPIPSGAKYFYCQRCQGSSFVGKDFCQDCRGVGLVSPIVAPRGERQTASFLYWGKRLDALSLIAGKVNHIFQLFLDFFLVVFGIMGLLTFFDPIFREFIKSRELAASMIFDRVAVSADGMLLFWISTFTDLYFIYRLARKKEKVSFVVSVSYDEGGTNPETKKLPEYAAIQWTDTGFVSEREKIDVSIALSQGLSQVIEKSWKLAQKLSSPEILPIHLFTVLFEEQRTQQLFFRLGIDVEKTANLIRNNLLRFDEKPAQTSLSFLVKKLLLDAYREAYTGRISLVGIDELLIVLSRVLDDIVSEIFEAIEITPDKMKNVVVWFRVRDQLRFGVSRLRRKAGRRSKSGLDRAMTAIATPILNAMSVDLTLAAKYGRLSPLVGREKELSEIFRIIAGTGEGVILYGYSGVGKTAIVEGIAQRMIEDDVPQAMRDKRLVSLSLPKLIAGATVAEAEERLLSVIASIEAAGNIVLFIDNIENMIGVSAGKGGGLDLSEVLTAALQRRRFICLATARTAEYHRYIESASSISQALHKVEIKEMSENEAIQAVEAKVGYIEYKNKVFFSYDALASAVKLADRYMHDKFLPDKAILLIEEAAVYAAQKRGERSQVTAEDVAEIVAQKTHIPVTKITEKESEKLLRLEEVMHERMVDQENAVKAVAASLRRARVEIRDTKRPISNFLFLGPTGVGKTECAKTVAEVFFGFEDNMIRLDMSEYQEKQSINRLIGAPPGPGGEAFGGYLTEAVRKNPFSLVLFDEIEKAHPDILNLFLQMMDDGRLTDATGNTIDFTETIIIMTSNAGTSYIQEAIGKHVPISEIKKALLESELKKYFRPEFLNRFDSISVFRPLEAEHVRQIAKLFLQKIRQQLAAKGIELEVEESAIHEFADAGFDPLFGARPLRRVIQEQVGDSIANAILSGKLERRDTVVLAGGGEIKIVRGRKI